MSARRVLYVAWAPFFSGAERALLLTLRSLDRARYEPFVLAGTEGQFADEVRALGIQCDVFPLRQRDFWRPAGTVRSVASVFLAASRVRASLVHTNELASFQTAGYAARMLGVPAVTHVRFPDTAEGYRWFLHAGFTRALFVSRDLLDDAFSVAADMFEGRAEVLHDGVEQQTTWTVQERSQRRGDLGLPALATIVAITGQVAEVKGIWDFVEAARILAQRDAPLHFAVLGDDLKTNSAMRRTMEARVHESGLSERFTFLGFRPDAPQIVQAFDVIAVPSHVEPLGNATLEAMAAGRPVVGSRVGGIPEMVVEGETGLLVPPKNPAALADAIWRIAADPLSAATMSMGARRNAAERFSIEAHGQALQDVYDRACLEPRRRGLGTRRASKTETRAAL